MEVDITDLLVKMSMPTLVLTQNSGKPRKHRAFGAAVIPS